MNTVSVKDNTDETLKALIKQSISSPGTLLSFREWLKDTQNYTIGMETSARDTVRLIDQWFFKFYCKEHDLKDPMERVSQWFYVLGRVSEYSTRYGDLARYGRIKVIMENEEQSDTAKMAAIRALLKDQKEKVVA